MMNKGDNNISINRSTDPYGIAIPEEIIQAYGSMFRDLTRLGWDGYMVTIMFREIPGSVDTKIRQMHQAVSTVYGRLATKVVRKPASQNWAPFLPRGYFFRTFRVIGRVGKS